MKPPVNFPYLIHIMFFAIVEFLILWICYRLDVRCRAMRTRTYKSPFFFIRYRGGKRISRLSFWLQVVNTIFVLAYIPIAILEFNYEFNRIVLSWVTFSFLIGSIILAIVAFIVDPINYPLRVVYHAIDILWLWAVPLYGDPELIIDEVPVDAIPQESTPIVVEEPAYNKKKKKKNIETGIYEFGWHSSPLSVKKKRICKKCGKELIEREVRVKASKTTEEGLNYYKTLSRRHKYNLKYFLEGPNIEFVYKKLLCYGCKENYDYATMESIEVVEKIFARVTKHFAKRNQPISIELAYETWDGEIIADTNDFSKIAYTCAVVTSAALGRTEFFKFKLRQKISFDKPYVVHVNEEKLIKYITEMLGSKLA